MNKQRLLKLADLLEANAKNKKGIRFDLTLWGEVNDEGNPMSCCTTACAMGLAALSGAFKRQGLKYAVTGEGNLNIGFGGTWNPIEAAMLLFQIDRTDAITLFVHQGTLAAMTGAKGERAVARRIRQFVAAD